MISQITLDPADDPRAVRRRERGAFVLGDIASNLTWSTVGTYLLFFYTDVALISAATAGTVILVARVLDGIFDPLVGIIMDRTDTRWGRARPYLLFGAPAVSVLLVLTFLTPVQGTGAIVYAAVTFILVGFAYSLVNVPYGALLAMTTRDTGTRMRIAGLRSFGVGLGLVLINGLTQPLVTAIGGSPTSRTGWAWTIAIYAVLAMVLVWLVFAWVKERVPLTPASREKGNLGSAVKALFRNRPWVIVAIFSVMAFLRIGCITGGAIYFALHVLHDPNTIALILLTFSVAAIIGSLLTPRVLLLLGARRGIIWGLLASVVLTIPMLFLRDNFIAFLVLFFVVSIVGGFGFVAAVALIAETVEWHEHQNGHRNEGLLFSGYSLAAKVGAALGSAVLAWGLAIVGYNPENVTPSASTGIVVLFLVVPAVVALLQVVVIGQYDLEKRMPEIKAALVERRGTAGAAGEA